MGLKLLVHLPILTHFPLESHKLILMWYVKSWNEDDFIIHEHFNGSTLEPSSFHYINLQYSIKLSGTQFLWGFSVVFSRIFPLLSINPVLVYIFLLIFLSLDSLSLPLGLMSKTYSIWETTFFCNNTDWIMGNRLSWWILRIVIALGIAQCDAFLKYCDLFKGKFLLLWHLGNVIPTACCIILHRPKPSLWFGLIFCPQFVPYFAYCITCRRWSNW